MEEKRISSHRRELRDFGGRHCLYRQQRRRRGSRVSGMAQRPADIRGFIGSAAARAVRVLNNDSETVLDVYQPEAGGANPRCGREVQRSVKVAVQSMTGKPVTKVNVHVVGLSLEDENA